MRFMSTVLPGSRHRPPTHGKGRWEGSDHNPAPRSQERRLTPATLTAGVEMSANIVHVPVGFTGGNDFVPPPAEREGFEPSEPVSQLNSLAVSPIRPLSHLSAHNLRGMGWLAAL